MSRGWDAPSRAAFRMIDRAELVADGLLADDVMPEGAVREATLPAHLLEAVLADARAQCDQVRGERAMFAPAGSPEAKVGDAQVRMWRARNQGLALLLDSFSGGPR